MQPSDASLAKFNIYRNIYNKLTYSAKKLYFQRELFLNQSNLKKPWDFIWLALNKKVEKSSSISNLLINSCTVSDPLEMANHFNNFFTSISSDIVSKIDPMDHPPDENVNYDNDIPLFSFLNTSLTGT